MILVVSLLSSIAFAQDLQLNNLGDDSLMDDVCSVKPTKKVHKRKKLVKKEVKEGDKTRVVVTVVEVPVKCPESPQQVVASPLPKPEDKFDWVGGIHAAFGGGARYPHYEGLFGVRLHYLPFHLGLEANVSPEYGVTGQLLVYTFQNVKIAKTYLSHHIDLGVVGYLDGLKLSVLDVPRTWDVNIGTGLEWQVAKQVSITLDWRVSVPNPVYIANHNQKVYDSSGNQVYGDAGRYLDVKAVLGNSLTQSHMLLGVLVHN